MHVLLGSKSVLEFLFLGLSLSKIVRLIRNVRQAVVHSYNSRESRSGFRYGQLVCKLVLR